MGCPVCDAKSLGAAKIRACHLGTSNPYQVANDLGCTYEQVCTHINEQHEISVDDEGNLQSQDMLLGKLTENIQTMENWSRFIITTVTEAKHVDRAKVDMLTKLMQEIRKTIESIATLQGRMGPGDTVIQMQILNMRVVDLTNLVLTNSCPDCKAKILAAMENKQLCSAPSTPLLVARP